MRTSLGMTGSTVAGVLAVVLVQFIVILQTPTAVDGGRIRKIKGSSSSSSGRITGGTGVPDGKYPFIARLEKWLNGKWSPEAESLCVILNRDWLVCPAFALSYYDNEGLPLDDFRFVLGDHYLNQTDEPYEQVVYPEYYIAHSRYNPNLGSFSLIYQDDIAVVKVTPSIKFSNRVTAANLPDSCHEDVEPGTIAYTAGWGYHGNRSGYFRYPINELSEIQSPIISLEECRQILGGKNITDLVLCIKTVNNSGWCFGDEGAPLIVVKNESYSVVVGLASVRPDYGYPCDVDGQAELYTRLSKYRGWIHRRISDCGNNLSWKKPPKEE